MTDFTPLFKEIGVVPKDYEQLLQNEYAYVAKRIYETHGQGKQEFRILPEEMILSRETIVALEKHCNVTLRWRSGLGRHPAIFLGWDISWKK